jgi:cysteinyl-tRNA synthetase
MKRVLSFHNTLTGRVGPLETMKPGEVGLYVCGITPYDETHLGHARCYVVFDVLKRVLLRNGYKVRHIQNFTDVDDKIIARAREMGKSPIDYPKPFMDGFLAHMDRLNVLRADTYPLVTTHMKEIVTLVSQLVEKKLAYVLDGSVYFRVRDFDRGGFPVRYGDLSKRNIDDLESGARVDVNERKNDPLDFALWKGAKPGEPAWDSPWGPGRPGWHIECSAMSMKYLGAEFDIHGGGLDLIFPHHTNEVAQSVGATGRRFARTWMHNGFVTINQQKMSKSLGNFFTLTDIFKKFDPMVVRYFLLSQHYRSPLNFSDQELVVAAKTWTDRVCGAHRIAMERSGGTADAAEDEAFEAALAADLNTAEALGVLNTFLSEVFSVDKLERESGNASDTAAWRRRFGKLASMLDALGLKVGSQENWPADVLELVTQRGEARARKDFKESDRIRDALKAKGFVVEDSAAGPRIKRIV